MMPWTDAFGRPEPKLIEAPRPTQNHVCHRDFIIGEHPMIHSASMSSAVKKSFWHDWPVRVWILLIALLVSYFCYQPDVAILKKQNPTTTSLIQLRKQQAKKAHIAYTPVMTWCDLDDISSNLVH